MEKYFNTIDGNKVNIVEHTLEQIGKYPSLKMYIGTDSQDYNPNTRYATAILYRYGLRGAHFIYLREEVPVVRDMFTRLYGEGVRTIEAAQLLKEEIPSISFEALEFDYNDFKHTLSSRVVSALRGWVKGLGMKASFKSGGQLATKAADHICRHKEMYP